MNYFLQMKEILQNLKSYLSILKIRTFFNPLIFILTIIISIIYYKHFSIFFLSRFYLFYFIIIIGLMITLPQKRKQIIIFNELFILLILIVLIFSGSILDNFSKGKLINTIDLSLPVLIMANLYSVGLYYIAFTTFIEYFNNDWTNFFKKKISKNLNKIIDTENIDNIDIKYNEEIKESKNISAQNQLLNFINYLILINNQDNLNKSLEYINKDFQYQKSFNLQDEIIIKIDNNITIEIVELFLKEEYIKIRNRNIIYYNIINFEGIIISANLWNIYKELLKIQNIILIYKSHLFDDPLNIKFINLIDLSTKDTPNILKNIKNIKNINSLSYEIVNITNEIYCLYNLKDKENIKIIDDILKKSTIIHKNNYKKSFILIYQGIIYIFISHEDNILNTKNILEPPFYLTLNSKKLEKTINDIKEQFKKILKLAL